MKIKAFSFVSVILLLPLFWLNEDDEPNAEERIPTGIMLDTMQNEVMLLLRDNQPSHYFANVFTPVCNTGECLPVKVNFYWDLTGEYTRFDQPEGEILTKLDHEPFTESDYILLHDILSGPDPRKASMSFHDSGVKRDQQDSQSQPAPDAMLKMDKYEMVDGITGSTLPEIKDQFVPGALYTTYTLWGLANDHKKEIKGYTLDKLVKPKNFSLFLKGGDYQTTEMVIDHMADQEEGENGRTKVLMSFLDTGDVELQLLALNMFYWKDYQMEDVQLMMHNKFYNSDELEVRKMILQRWAYNHMDEGSLKMLSVNVNGNQDVMDGIIAVYLNKPDWPEGVFENLVEEIEKLEPANQQSMINMFKSRKDHLSNEQWKKVKELEKKY